MIYIAGRWIDVRRRDARADRPASGSRRSRAGPRGPGDDVHEASREPADRAQGPDRRRPEAADGPGAPHERRPPGGDGSSHSKRGAAPAGDAERACEPRDPTTGAAQLMTLTFDGPRSAASRPIGMGPSVLPQRTPATAAAARD